MLAQIVLELKRRPSILIGLILVIVAHVASPIRDDFKLLSRVYMGCVGVLLVAMPYLTDMANVDFSFSKLLEKPLTQTNIVIILVIILLLSQLSPASWLIEGRINVEKNRNHFVMNGIGAILTIGALLLLNKLPINLIAKADYNKLFMIELLTITFSFFLGFSFTSRVEHEEAANLANRFAPCANALWLSVAMSVCFVAFIHAIASFGTDTKPIILKYFDVRVVLLLISLTFLISYLYSAIGGFQKSLFTVFLIGFALVLGLAIKYLFEQPGGTFGNEYRTWVLAVILTVSVLVVLFFTKRIQLESSANWNSWATIVTALFLFMLAASSDVQRFYEHT